MLEVLLAGFIVATIGLPVVTIFDKWKKEMEQDEREGR